MRRTIRGKNKNSNIYQIYAPQQCHTQEEKDNFIELLDLQLEEQTEGVNILLGDFNARVGSERRGIENIIGPFGQETRDVEGENLTDFCLRNNLRITNGFFKGTGRSEEVEISRNITFSEKILIDSCGI